MAFTIRNMTMDDTAALVEIENQCFTDPWSESMVKDLADSTWDEVWVLELDESREYEIPELHQSSKTGQTGAKAVIGYINYRFIAGEGELMRIAVLSEYRGHGYSRKLMDIMTEHASKAQVPDITLEVRAGNVPAIGLYKSYGFAEEAVRRGYYHNPTEDALIMWLRGLPSIPT